MKRREDSTQVPSVRLGWRRSSNNNLGLSHVLQRRCQHSWSRPAPGTNLHPRLADPQATGTGPYAPVPRRQAPPQPHHPHIHGGDIASVIMMGLGVAVVRAVAYAMAKNPVGQWILVWLGCWFVYMCWASSHTVQTSTGSQLASRHRHHLSRLSPAMRHEPNLSKHQHHGLSSYACPITN